MFTETEFVLSRVHDRELGQAVGDAQRIINAKNRALVELRAAYDRMEAELEIERARRRRAEFLLNRH